MCVLKLGEGQNDPEGFPSGVNRSSSPERLHWNISAFHSTCPPSVKLCCYRVQLNALEIISLDATKRHIADWNSVVCVLYGCGFGYSCIEQEMWFAVALFKLWVNVYPRVSGKFLNKHNFCPIGQRFPNQLSYWIPDMQFSTLLMKRLHAHWSALVFLFIKMISRRTRGHSSLFHTLSLFYKQICVHSIELQHAALQHRSGTKLYRPKVVDNKPRLLNSYLYVSDTSLSP